MLDPYFATAVTMVCMYVSYSWGKKQGIEEGQMGMVTALLSWFEDVAGAEQLIKWMRKDEIGAHMETLYTLGKELDETCHVITVKFDIQEGNFDE